MNHLTNKFAAVTKKRLQLLTICALLPLAAMAQDSQQLPHLEQTDNTTRLIVDGKPFIMLAGEWHNSSTGSAGYMADRWQRMKEQNVNTVLASVSWELLEPEEGKFDFTQVDNMIEGARKYDLKLVILWFGSWKNGASTYVPGWVKKDYKRFPLACMSNGQTMNTLSTLGENTLQADLKAYSTLMRHIKEVDGDGHTVIMMQIENEIGTVDMASMYMGTDNHAMRDYSALAEKAYRGEMPSTLLQYMSSHSKTLHPALAKAWENNGKKTKGTWEEVLGKSEKGVSEDWQNTYPYFTEEAFNAWNYGSFVEQLARAGKEIHPIPVYVNAWIKQASGPEPGKYPSGGPQPHVFDIWHAAAPSVDFFAPDIYATDIFEWTSNAFHTASNPLFIPETNCNADGASRAFYTFGRHASLGYAPFGIDGDGIINSAIPGDESFKKAYGLLHNLMPYIQAHAGSESMKGLLIGKYRNADSVAIGDYVVTLRPFDARIFQAVAGVAAEERKLNEENTVGALVIQVDKDEFIVAGGVGEAVIGIAGGSDIKQKVGIMSIDEIVFDTEGHETLHRLNGDEASFGGAVILFGQPKAFRIKVYQYE